MHRSTVVRWPRRPPAALMLAATTVLGLSATVAIFRLTSPDVSELTLPIAPSGGAKTSTRGLSSEPRVRSTTPTVAPTTSAEPAGGGSVPTSVSSPGRPDPRYRWERVPGVAELVGPGAESGLSAVALVEGEGLLAVGNASSAPVVLVSAEGQEWTRVEEAEQSLEGAVLRDVAVVGEHLVLVGSFGGEPAAWASSDGVGWTPIPITTPGEGRTLGLLDGIAVSADGTVVAVGFASGTSGIWTLAEDSFTSVQGLRPLSTGGQVLADVASTGVGLLAGGNDADGRPVIWRSEDAHAWVRSDLPADGRGASVAAVGEVAGRLIAVGYDGAGARMWTLAGDGRWLDVAAPPAIGGLPQALWAVATGRSGALAGGQRPGGPLCWASGDGAAWVDCQGEGDLVVATARDLIATSDGFVAVGSATAADSGAGAAIWRVEQDNQAAMPR